MSFHFLTSVNSHDNYSKKCYYSIVVSRRKPPCEVHLHDRGARLGGLPRSSFSSRSRQVLSTPQLTVDSVECRYLWVSAARHTELWHRWVCVYIVGDVWKWRLFTRKCERKGNPPRVSLCDNISVQKGNVFQEVKSNSYSGS